ncbi:DUF930 domain-containing protein [Labrenzia sp. 011]|uniref:DUF930 domain-containing protein n=1 Tax=Labrenzia sp. 011 TaxID=2171494 RepID=UPI000D50CCBC|nr:DUF930 domain-containing protein [Labrenzia sp. 011]PVB60740.1 hypothetical protein DCO57_15075 [Labrenzia sp. 011]
MGTAERTFVNNLVADRFSWICAIWLHLLFFALLSSQAGRERTALPAPEPISVEIIVQPFPVPEEPPQARERPEAGNAEALSAAPDQGPAGPTGARERETMPGEPPATGAPREEPSESGWVVASGFYAGDVLSDPRSAQARQALTSVTGDDRIDQLCALEAMEQVRHSRPGFRPTRVMPHARRNSFRKDNLLLAPAGALRSNRIWYEIAYRCRLDAGGTAIIGFEYALGPPIVRTLWDELGLAPIH